MIRYLICLLVILTSPAAADTTWWHTRDAAVIGRTHTCSLYIYNSTQAVIMSWDVDGAESLAFQDRKRFHFIDDEPVVVTIHIDDSLLAADTGYGNHDLVIVPVPQVDTMLPDAHDISVVLATANVDEINLTMPVNTSKMPTLLAAVERCRATLR